MSFIADLISGSSYFLLSIGLGGGRNSFSKGSSSSYYVYEGIY